MAKAGLTIAISGTYNGRALEKAREDLERMRVTAAAELGGAGSSLVSFGGALAEVGGEIHNVGYNMEAVGKKATAGLTVPIVAAATACGKAAIDIDDALTGVRKTVDMTEEGYQSLKDAAIEYSKTNAVSATDVLLAEELAGQLGVSAENLETFAHVATGLDIATNMNVEQASTNLARFANVTNMATLEGKDAERAYQAYGNVIVGLGNNLATTESEISDFSLRMASAGTQAGMTEADILGIAGAMSSLGLEAASGGSSFSKTISEISIAVATGSDDLEAFASVAQMSAEDFAAYWREDATGAFIQFITGLSESSEDMNVILDGLGIKELRQSDALRRLAGNTDLLTRSVDLANREWREGSALADEVANKNSSFSARLQMLQNKVIGVAESVGTPLVDALMDVIDAGEPLIQTVADVAKGFAKMDKGSQQSVLKMVALAAAFGPAMTGAGKLVQGVGDLVVGLGKGAQTAGLFIHELGTVKETFQLVAGGAGTLSEGMGLLKSSTSLVSGAMGALQVGLAGVAVGAVAFMGVKLVEHLRQVREHEEQVERATNGLESAMDSARIAYDAYYTGTEGAIRSLGEVKEATEDVIAAQAELAQSMTDQWTEIGTNAAVVDSYAQEIADLTQAYRENGEEMHLTAEEQTRLKLAVDGYNEATGSTIEVIDAENGILSTSTDVILANAEAFKERARQEAAIEMYKDLYKQQLEDEIALNSATEELNRLKELEQQAWIGTGEYGVNPYTEQVREAQAQVDEISAAMESNMATQEQLMDVIQGSGRSFGTLEEALDSAGVSMGDFGDLTDEELAELERGFDGHLTSIVTSCNEQGIEIPHTLADAINREASAATDAARDMGEDIDNGLAEGIEGNADAANQAADDMGEGLLDWLRGVFGVHSPSTETRDIGEDLDAGLAEGIEGNSDEPEGAMGALADLIQGAIDDLPDWSSRLGGDASAKLSKGLTKNKGSVTTSGGALYTAAQSATNPLIAALGTIGLQSASRMASQMGAMVGQASAAGSNLGASARNGASSATSSMGIVGSNAAVYFSNAIARSSAYGSGQSLAVTARNGMGSVSAYNTGHNFAVGFANGAQGVSLYNIAYNMGRSALSGIKSALKIKSPSREAMEVGEFFGEGAVIGMKSTEADLAAEALRMSQAMTLTPTVGSYGSGYGSSYISSYQQQAARGSYTFNVNINVTAADASQATSIGRNIGDELFLEFQRRERNAA